MRQIARVPQPTTATVRLMIYDDGTGVYLFGFNTLLDYACRWDEWYETVAYAQDAAQDKYGVGPADWQAIPDPLPNCRHDWIAPVRLKGAAEGATQRGCFEMLINNKWVDILPLTPRILNAWTSFNLASK